MIIKSTSGLRAVIAQAKREQGMTDYELAKRTKLTVTTVTRYLQGGHDARNSSTLRYLEALGLEMEVRRARHERHDGTSLH